MTGVCDKGLTRDCFKAHPQWAKQAFCYRLLHAITPKQLSKNLPRIFRIPLPFPGVLMPADVNLPAGTVIGPGAEISPGLAPGDPLPAGVLDTPSMPIGFDESGSISASPFDFFPPGPPGPPGATSKSGSLGIDTGPDLTETEMTSLDRSTYYVTEVDGNEAFDNDVETRAYWRHPAPVGTNTSRLFFNFAGNAQVINALRVHTLHNDTGDFWTFGRWIPIYVPLISSIKNKVGWSDLIRFANVTASTKYVFRANNTLAVEGQESWLYEIELFHI